MGLATLPGAPDVLTEMQRNGRQPKISNYFAKS
jgi:hypothetical protein